MLVREPDNVELPIGVNVYQFLHDSLMIDWQPVHGVPHLSPYDSWDKRQLLMTVSGINRRK